MSNNEEKEKLTDHNYDGIQELDNVLPRWWLWLFYLTILFSCVYYGYYELGTGTSIQEEFANDVAAMETKKASLVNNTFPDMTKLSSFQKNAQKISSGKTIFEARCTSCHGDKGQGMIGPNLTDNYWIHGEGKLEAIAKVIHDGILDKGMPPWSALLSEDDVYAVTAYVKSLKGSNPPGAKTAQGQLTTE